MSYIKLNNKDFHNSADSFKNQTGNDFKQIIARTETTAGKSPFTKTAGNTSPLLIADASNFDFRKLGLNGERLGYPEQKNTQQKTRQQNKPTNGKSPLNARNIFRGAGWVGAALLINDALQKLVGPAPILKTQLALGNNQDLAITVYGKEYKGPEAEPGTAFFTRGIGGEKLDVPVSVTDTGITFDPGILQQQYGKQLPDNLKIEQVHTNASDRDNTPGKPDLRPGFAVETRTQDEKDLVGSMLSQGKSSAEINSALNEMRNRKEADSSSGYKPFPKKYEYDTTVKKVPRMGAGAMVFVMPKGGKEAHDGVLSGTFNEVLGDLNINFYSSSLDGKNIGTELISSAIEHIGPSKVKTVSGSLLFDRNVHDKLLKTHSKTNLSVYRKNIADGMSMEQAVWNTPLGKSMTRLGFNDLAITSVENLDIRFGFK